MKMYEVGGCVRDELLGIRSKDIDFAVVLPDTGYVDPFRYMTDTLEAEGFKLIPEAERPQYFTARGFFPKDHAKYPGKAADFVLARVERGYADKRRPDSVAIGTLEQDLARRDFTMNAIAKDFEGNLIDPHNGQLDIRRKIIRAVGDPLERLSEDPLRAIRAIRFMVTKGFHLDMKLANALTEPAVIDGVASSAVPDERITEELSKMFQHDTVRSLVTLNMFHGLMEAAFSGKVSLDATMKTKGRG